MGMTLLFAGLLGLAGLVTLFVAPWVGGGLLIVAVLAGLAAVLWASTHADELAAEREEPETPHMRGPSS